MPKENEKQPQAQGTDTATKTDKRANKRTTTQTSSTPQFRKRTVALKLNPQTNTFASISLVFKSSPGYTLDENEFIFLLVVALKTIHGEITNQPDVLSFTAHNSQSYSAIIRFKTIHYTRVVTSLLLFGHFKLQECKFEIQKTASTPCFLTV